MKTGFSLWPCSVARAADVFGDAWSLLIIRESIYGLSRFDEYHRSINIARNTLSDRLSKLVEAGVLSKRFYQDNPPRYEYVLTEMGRELFPVLSAMLAWGDKWLEPDGPPVTLFHEPCGHDVEATVVCGHCGVPIVDEDVQFCVGPGYPDEVADGDIRDRLALVPGATGGRPRAKATDAESAEGEAAKSPQKSSVPARGPKGQRPGRL
jgi:DNA-binding HxlR family transcriptional regulator